MTKEAFNFLHLFLQNANLNFFKKFLYLNVYILRIFFSLYKGGFYPKLAHKKQTLLQSLPALQWSFISQNTNFIFL